ncbi:hypothetical protein Vadar_021066 [Vaccinium darrowii]|uniref:Uncharacterized protein n=1 Tax=Vaccinium darrowii TaxID=229202 RepID=A0ACB7YY60_9ERIC|nr:hypothetical protein Vadar_021066 [Vaccinium darrowii]
MTDNQNPKNSPSSSSSNSRVPTEANHNGTAAASGQKAHYPNPPEIGYNGSSNAHKHPHYPNPPDPINPDPATMREQWRYCHEAVQQVVLASVGIRHTRGSGLLRPRLDRQRLQSSTLLWKRNDEETTKPTTTTAAGGGWA